MLSRTNRFVCRGLGRNPQKSLLIPKAKFADFWQNSMISIEIEKTPVILPLFTFLLLNFPADSNADSYCKGGPVLLHPASSTFNR